MNLPTGLGLGLKPRVLAAWRSHPGAPSQAVAHILERQVRRSRAQLGLAVMYHGIGTGSGDRLTDPSPVHGRQLFEDQLALLVKRYNVVTASELRAAVRKRRPGEPLPVALTFDDDLRSHLDTAVPVLQAASVRATFFINEASPTPPPPYWWEVLALVWQQGRHRELSLFRAGHPPTAPEAAFQISRLHPRERTQVEMELTQLVSMSATTPRLTKRDLTLIVEAGHELGFHTKRHANLTSLQPDELARSLTEGRSTLADIQRAPVKVLAYPFGFADQRTAAAGRAADFDAGFTVRPSAVTPFTDPLLLGRMEPSLESVLHFRLQLALAAARGRIAQRPTGRRLTEAEGL
jgi:peptidoglycan/xylan/chitin deacetylase (PgdA/CDA1 family)